MRLAMTLTVAGAILSLALLSAGCKPEKPAAQTPKETSVKPEAKPNQPQTPVQPETKPAPNQAETQPKGNPLVVIDTSEGAIKVELFADKAPATVANFLQYVDDKFYDGTIFHRVIDGFMIQGGGFTPDMQQKKTRAAIQNEAANGLKNDLGTLAMARTSDVNSATAQFFVNVANNGPLNHKDTSPRGFGYCVFGKVIAGMDVVDRIKAVPTQNSGSFQNVPAKPVIITSIRRAN